jgi:hypothetical protein
MFHALRVYSGDKQKCKKENYRNNKKCKKTVANRIWKWDIPKK